MLNLFTMIYDLVSWLVGTKTALQRQYAPGLVGYIAAVLPPVPPQPRYTHPRDLYRQYASALGLHVEEPWYVPITHPHDLRRTVHRGPTYRPVRTRLTALAACVTECAICQEVGTGAASRINRCGHVYHTSCLSPWLVNNSTCPMCRATV